LPFAPPEQSVASEQSSPLKPEVHLQWQLLPSPTGVPPFMQVSPLTPDVQAMGASQFSPLKPARQLHLQFPVIPIIVPPF